MEVSLERPGWGLWSGMTAGAPAWEGPGSSGFPSLVGRLGGLGSRVGLEPSLALVSPLPAWKFPRRLNLQLLTEGRSDPLALELVSARSLFQGT